MARLDMYMNSEHKGHHCPPIMSPRISFSNDFVESGQQIINQERASRESPVSSDFEFSVSNFSMMSGADELFSKGRLLPFKDGCSSIQMHKVNTLRDELLVEDDGEDEVSLRPPKGSARWKGLLGRKKSHIGPKKGDKSDGSVERRNESRRRSGSARGDAHSNMTTSQELLSDGGSSSRDVEMEI